jgi:hypothetical protein
MSWLLFFRHNSDFREIKLRIISHHGNCALVNAFGDTCRYASLLIGAAFRQVRSGQQRSVPLPICGYAMTRGVTREECSHDLSENQLFRQQGHSQRKNQSGHDGDECNCQLHDVLLHNR